MSPELIYIMLWSWLQGYNAGLESAEEKIKKAFAEADEETKNETKEESNGNDEDESTPVCSKVSAD